MFGIPELILVGLFVVVPVGCLANWYAGLQRLSLGWSLLPQHEKGSVPWGLLDLGVFAVIVVLVVGFGVAMAQHIWGVPPGDDLDSLSLKQQAFTFLAFGTTTLIAVAASIIWIWMRFGLAGVFRLIDPQHVSSDTELGLRWFMMLIVPVVCMQLVLTQWFPSRHPLIELLKESKDLSFLPVAAYAAVVTAPIFEEVFFRAFLQGWLEKLAVVGSLTGSAAVPPHPVPSMSGTAVQTGDQSEAAKRALLLGGVVHSAGGEDDNAESSTQSGAEQDDSADTPADECPPVAVRWWPILVSSLVFALAHFSHGPDWVPLFFLALGLGYIYQRTGRIQACIVVHILVNALGMLQLWALIRQA